jgi:hypothetical protein
VLTGSHEQVHRQKDDRSATMAGNIAVHTGPAANEWKGHIKAPPILQATS